MDSKDRSIATQVAFKGAIDLAVQMDLDLSSPGGQKAFEESFSYLTESLTVAITAQQSDEERVAQVIQGQFPGSTVVSSHPSTAQYAQPDHVQPPAYNLVVKNEQFGPLPDWLYEQAAARGVTEVYDNRKDVQGTKRPWFRAVSDKDIAFWPPR